MREYIGDYIHIDGRMIAYRIINNHDYFEAKGFSEKEIDEFYDCEIAELVNQILAIKQSCFLLRRTTYSCQSLTDNLYSLKLRLIDELNERHKFQFDDEFVERYEM